jgi:hypothetical protein
VWLFYISILLVVMLITKVRYITRRKGKIVDQMNVFIHCFCTIEYYVRDARLLTALLHLVRQKGMLGRSRPSHE